AISGLDCSSQNVGSAGGMDGQHAHTKSRCRLYRVGHGVWNVVELEVQENPAAGTDQLFDKPPAFGAEQLQASFVDTCSVSNATHELARVIGVGDIEGYNQPLAGLQRAGRRHYRDFA